MSLKLLFIMLVSNKHMCIWSQSINDESLMDISTNRSEIYTQNKASVNIISDQVEVKLYYECFCGGCREFDTGKFKHAILKFGDHIKIYTNPYGFAKTIVDNGTITFKCQHGPGECYGNMLHACALDIIQNHTVALLYNSCMMDDTQKNSGSDDDAADKCGSEMNLDSKPIKECAKGVKGTQLLKHYGEETTKVDPPYVPYTLVNSKESFPDTFIKDICDAFTNPPPECNRQYNEDNIM